MNGLYCLAEGSERMTGNSGTTDLTQPIQTGSPRVTRKHDFRIIPVKSFESMTTFGPAGQHCDSIVTQF
jgi:hypothetical protein